MFHKSWNNEAGSTSDNAAFANSEAMIKVNTRFGPTLNELQRQDQTRLTPIKPRSHGWSLYWKIRLGAFVIAAVCGVVSASWKEIEKVAPGLNKAIHSNVTSQEDVDYHAAKLEEARKQYDELTTHASGQSAEDFNKEFISQGPVALHAMEYETAELKEAIPHEKMTEECRPLVDNMFKEMEAYYRVEEMVFKAVASRGDDTQFKAIGNLEDTAVANLHKSVSNFRADKSCKDF